jgi:hypothetical protein
MKASKLSEIVLLILAVGLILFLIYSVGQTMVFNKAKLQKLNQAPAPEATAEATAAPSSPPPLERCLPPSPEELRAQLAAEIRPKKRLAHERLGSNTMQIPNGCKAGLTLYRETHIAVTCAHCVRDNNKQTIGGFLKLSHYYAEPEIGKSGDGFNLAVDDGWGFLNAKPGDFYFQPVDVVLDIKLDLAYIRGVIPAAAVKDREPLVLAKQSLKPGQIIFSLHHKAVRWRLASQHQGKTREHLWDGFLLMPIWDFSRYADIFTGFYLHDLNAYPGDSGMPNLNESLEFVAPSCLTSPNKRLDVYTKTLDTPRIVQFLDSTWDNWDK